MPSEAEYNEQALFDARQKIKQERDELRIEVERLRGVLKSLHSPRHGVARLGCRICDVIGGWLDPSRGETA